MMEVLEFLKDMREDTPVDWKELDDAIKNLEDVVKYIDERLDKPSLHETYIVLNTVKKKLEGNND